MAGSLVSLSLEFREFLQFSGLSIQPAHFRGKKWRLLVPLIIGLVNDKLLPPFREHLLLAGHSPYKLSGPSRSRAHRLIPGYAAADGTFHCAQRARL